MDSSPASVHSMDVPHLLATITQLVDERSTLRGELALLRFQLNAKARAEAEHSVHVVTLTENLASMRLSLHAILHLQHSASGQGRPDHAESDDDEESILELYELRRWKAQFAADQTRNLIDRVEELTARVHELEQEM